MPLAEHEPRTHLWHESIGIDATFRDQSAGWFEPLPSVRITDAREVVVFRTPRDPANIPHDIENRAVAASIDPDLDQQASGPFFLRRRRRNRPGGPSQGGDTGSTPVGTASENSQVSGMVQCRRLVERRLNARYPANIRTRSCVASARISARAWIHSAL
jgi:hypothetical protein